MHIERRNTSDFIDLDITDGDALWYCTDRYNASGENRLGGGRLRLRDVHWRGDRIISHSDIDYSLKVSSTPTSEQYWVSNQAGMETDMSNLVITVDGAVTALKPGDRLRADNVTIDFTTQVCLDDPAHTPFASMRWRYVWQAGVYDFGVNIDYLATVYRWYEYASATPTDGACGTSNPWKCDRVENSKASYTALGCHGEPSNWIWTPADKDFRMYLSRNGGVPHTDQARVTVSADVEIPQLINDHGSNRVITCHVTNDGTNPVQQAAGDNVRHQHSITLE